MRLLNLGVIAVVLVTTVFCLGSGAQEVNAPTPQTATQENTAIPPAPTPAPVSQPFYAGQDYSKPRSHFPNPIAPYMPRHVPPPNLANTPRIDQVMHDGKIMLSIDDAVALALENNLDIAIARYNLNIADQDLMRAKSGNAILGVPSGIVQNTPGGGVGGFGTTVGSGTGGTSVAPGGIGTGTNGLVQSTSGIGAPITSFDPIITSNLQWDHFNQVASSLFTGVPILAQNTQTYNFNYIQGLPSGTNVSVGFNNGRVTTNSPFNNYSPIINTNFQFKLTQNLLQGFGFLPNTRFIRIARNNREISDVAFRLQILTTVDQVENMYWDLVYAYENVRVQQESLAFAQKTLSDTEKQVQIGSLAPIETVRARSTVASDQQMLITAQNNLQLQQLLMKNALSRSLQDPHLADAEVIPTSTMKLPAQEPVIPTEDLVSDALAHRAELAESRIDLTNRQINNKAVRNAQLPTLQLFAYYGGSGLAGAQNPANLCANQSAAVRSVGFCSGPDPDLGGQTLIPPSETIGYNTALNNLINSTAPDKGLGVNLNIPLRNRNAQSNQVRAELEFRQAQMRLQQIENQIRIEVRNAQFTLSQNRAAVEAAQAAVELGKQSLEAEQKKLSLGASTSTLVLQNQSALATSESTLMSAMANYEKARVELDRATGLLLDHSGIVMADAERGEVTHMPDVPYVGPRENPQSLMPEARPTPTPAQNTPQPQ
ncbi:MAG TPA: TolC family protein [Terriglobales bacterium]|nr:TolC family protein [Terriglobales bacterium]